MSCLDGSEDFPETLGRFSMVSIHLAFDVFAAANINFSHKHSEKAVVKESLLITLGWASPLFEEKKKSVSVTQTWIPET